MKTLKALFAAAFLVALSSLQLAAQNVPLAISYQAVLTDDAGDPLSPGTPTNYDLIFRIYDSVEDGALLWSEGQGVSVLDGSFSTLLGTGDDVPDGGENEPRPQLNTIFDESERYLEITISDGALKTFTPRQRMVSAPFAFRSLVAEHALSVEAGAVSTGQILNGSVTQVKMDTDSVSADQIEANAVGASEIAANAVGASEIASGAVNIAELAAAVQNQLVPAGTVVAWAGNPSNIPAGWLLCDGSAYNPGTYPKLYATISSQYDVGGAFWALPDYRGYFLRGDAMATGRDPDRNARTKTLAGSISGFSFEGSAQGDAFKSHNHKWGYWDTNDGSGDYDREWDTSSGRQRYREHDTTSSGGSTETRPDNKYVHYIIKAH